MQLQLAGLNPTQAVKIQQKDFCGRIGFPQYVLTNNLANIKRIGERISILEAKAIKASEAPYETFTFEGGKVVMDRTIDRVQIIHASRPGPEVISQLKHRGFHWSPTNRCWQRQITRDAIYATEMLTAIKIS
jgi:hypothetical protein